MLAPFAAGAEELPWANKPLEAQAAAVPGADQAALEAATSQCIGQFEASCRDLKTCSWVADIARPDGTLVPARCVARPPAPPKAKTAKKAPAKSATPSESAKKETVAAPAEAIPPVTKATVTQVEPEVPAPPKKAAAKAKPVPDNPAPKKQATIEPAAAPAEAEPAPVAVETSPAAEKQADAKPEPKAKDEPKKAEVKAPIVVAPPKPAAQKMPSFGSISPVMPGSEANAVIVTVPVSQD